VGSDRSSSYQGGARPATAGEADEPEDLVFGRSLRSGSEVQAARLSEARVESGNREGAAPVAPFGGTGAAEATLARVGPTTPTRAGRLADASVDPSEARNSDTGFRVRQPDIAKPIKLAVHARWPHPLPTICPLTLVRPTRVVEAWPALPDAIKAGIMAMIEAALVRQAADKYRLDIPGHSISWVRALLMTGGRWSRGARRVTLQGSSGATGPRLEGGRSRRRRAAILSQRTVRGSRP